MAIMLHYSLSYLNTFIKITYSNIKLHMKSVHYIRVTSPFTITHGFIWWTFQNSSLLFIKCNFLWMWLSLLGNLVSLLTVESDRSLFNQIYIIHSHICGLSCYTLLSTYKHFTQSWIVVSSGIQDTLNVGNILQLKLLDRLCMIYLKFSKINNQNYGLEWWKEFWILTTSIFL